MVGHHFFAKRQKKLKMVNINNSIDVTFIIKMDLFLSDHPLDRHFESYHKDRDTYVDSVFKIFSNKQLVKNIKSANKARPLVVLLQNLDKDGFNRLLEHIDLPELTRACEVLDSNRYLRQLQSREDTREYQLRDVKELSEGISTLSLSLAKIKMVKLWVRQLDADDLIYRALLFPVKDNWKKLADLTHLNASKDFAIDWFLPYCFGSPAPEDSVVAKFESMTLDNFIEIDQEFNLSYKLFRVKFASELKRAWSYPQLNEIKKYFAGKESLKVCLWWWDELQTPEVNDILAKRLKDAETIDLSYGKLVDLLMNVKHDALFEELVKIAEHRLRSFEVTLDSPVALLGDASASMQVAINTSSIITSLLCSLAKAELHIFKNTDIPIENPPNSVRSAVEFARTMRANNSTSPASSLWPYYAAKKVVKTFIIVTDEEENTSTTGYQSWSGRSGRSSTRSNVGYFFADLYKKYCETVYPAKLIFISFSDQNKDAQMVKDLKEVIGEKKCEEYVQTYKFNTQNPDLNRLDYVLEKISS
jgi:hypothetical protein